MGLFDGRVGFVTGAARGQGRGHAVRLAEEGADVVLLDLCAEIEGVAYSLGTAEQLAETAQLVRDVGRRAIARHADVRDQDSLDAAVEEALEVFGRIDIVSAVAGIAGHGAVVDLSPDTWAGVIDVNLSGVWRTVKAVIPSMRNAGNGGSIVITSSVAGLRGQPNSSHYVASKHGLIGLMRVLALEVAGDGIRVNALCPTGVRTAMVTDDPALWRRLRPDLEAPSLEDINPVVAEMHLLSVGLIETDDATNAFAWLASDAARYVTGVALPVDAGVLVK